MHAQLAQHAQQAQHPWDGMLSTIPHRLSPSHSLVASRLMFHCCCGSYSLMYLLKEIKTWRASVKIQ